jgi:hypothetical protein
MPEPLAMEDNMDTETPEAVWGGVSERGRRALPARLARLPKWVRYCPAHGVALSGGPVLYHCPAGRLGTGSPPPTWTRPLRPETMRHDHRCSQAAAACRCSRRRG